MWDEVGKQVKARRAELHLTREALATRAKVSPRLLGDLETGRRGNFDDVTIARVEHALGWVHGSIGAILQGKEPTVTPASAIGEIQRQLARDDFVLTALLAQSGLSQVDLFRLNLRIRARREEQAIELLGEVGRWLAEAGGRVPDSVWPPTWLMRLIEEQDQATPPAP